MPIKLSGELSATNVHVGRGAESTKTHRGTMFPPRWTVFFGTD